MGLVISPSFTSSSASEASLRTRGPRRMARRKTLSGVDDLFSGDHGDNKSTGFFSVPRFHAGPRVGVLSLVILVADRCALCVPALRCVEQGIRYQRSHGSLPEFFRPCRTAFPENSCHEGTRANRNRAFLRHLAGPGAAAFARWASQRCASFAEPTKPGNLQGSKKVRPGGSAKVRRLRPH